VAICTQMPGLCVLTPLVHVQLESLHGHAMLQHSAAFAPCRAVRTTGFSLINTGPNGEATPNACVALEVPAGEHPAAVEGDTQLDQRPHGRHFGEHRGGAAASAEGQQALPPGADDHRAGSRGLADDLDQHLVRARPDK